MTNWRYFSKLSHRYHRQKKILIKQRTPVQIGNSIFFQNHFKIIISSHLIIRSIVSVHDIKSTRKYGRQHFKFQNDFAIGLFGIGYSPIRVSMKSENALFSSITEPMVRNHSGSNLKTFSESDDLSYVTLQLREGWLKKSSKARMTRASISPSMTFWAISSSIPYIDLSNGCIHVGDIIL